MDISTALVTGANKGIGKEIARKLVQAGLTVYVCSRDAERAAHAVADIGGDARPMVLDVTDPVSVAAVAERIHTLDVLVNNAGISPAQGRGAQDEDAETFRRVYEANVFGVITVTNALLPALKRSAHPRIVNISSGTGSLTSAAAEHSGYRGAFASYRSSKAALNALTVFYAQSLAEHGVKVNALAPGLRRTDANDAAATSGGDPAEAASGALRLALLPDDGPSGAFFSWDGTSVSW